MPLISEEQLYNADKILFIDALAIGDFCYFQNFYAAFSRKYPHLKIDLWVEEVRRSSNPKEWPALKNYALYDWLRSIPYFRHIYTETYSPQLFRESRIRARGEEYPIVVSLGTRKAHHFANLARDIAPKGYIVGQKKSPLPFQLNRILAYRKLDASLPPPSGNETHISDRFANWFQALFALQLDAQQRHPYLDLPKKATRAIQEWLKERALAESNPLILINPFAKMDDRSWGLTATFTLIQKLRNHPHFKKGHYIINVAPERLAEVVERIGLDEAQYITPFTAADNFFQLPALLAEVDLVISAETSVMHLANLVGSKTLALMRAKNPEWVPYNRAITSVIFTKNLGDHLYKIPVTAVYQEVIALLEG